MILNVIPENIAGWRELAFFGAFLTLPLTILLTYLSETPFYLIKKGNEILLCYYLMFL